MNIRTIARLVPPRSRCGASWVVSFLLADAGVNGLTPYAAGSYVTTIGSVTETSVAGFTAAQNVSSSRKTYVIRTNADLTSSANAVLRITSVGVTAGAGQGGLVTYGSPTISASIVFDPSAASGGSAASGEGVIYVGGTTTLTGNVTANGLTKFGNGILILNGNTQVQGATSANGFAVQAGTLRIGSSAALLAGVTALNVNLGATVDLNGNTLRVGSLNAAANNSGGLITNDSATAANLTVASSAFSSVWAGQIQDGAGVVSLSKDAPEGQA